MSKKPERKALALGRLRIFDAVASHGAMNAAADALHVTQPAVTLAIQTLEAELSAKLLARQPRGVQLTEQGAIFARRVQRFFQQLSSALIVAGIVDKEEEDAAARLARRIGNAHFQALAAVWQAGNFRGAARSLGIADPTLHRAARDFERLLETTLYRRTPQGVSLSATGVELARRFVLAMKEVETGIEEVANFEGSAQTVVSIGILPLAPKRLLAIATETLFRSNDHSHLTIQEAVYPELIDALRRGAIDLIVGPIRAVAPFEDVKQEALFHDPHSIVCRRGHPLMAKRHPVPNDLKGFDWIFPTALMPRRGVLDAIIREWGLSQRIQIETSALGMIVAMLAESDRLSLLPSSYVDAYAHSLSVVAIEVPQPPRMVGLTIRKNWLPSRSQLEVMTCLRSIKAPSFEWGERLGAR